MINRTAAPNLQLSSGHRPPADHRGDLRATPAGHRVAGSFAVVYACAGRRLVPASLPVKVMRHAAIRLSVIPLAALFSIAGSFIDPRLSLFLYLLVIFAYGLVPRAQLPGKESI